MDTLLPYFFSQALGGLAEKDHAAVVRNMYLAAASGTVGVALNLVGFRVLTRHEASMRSRLSLSTFAELISKDVQFFVDQKVGALTSRYIDFVRAYVTLQDLLIIRTLGFSLSVVIGLILVASQAPSVALIMGLLIAALLIEIRWSLKKRAPYRHARKKLAGEIHGTVADAVTNYLVVKTFAREAAEQRTLAKQEKRFRTLFIRDIGFLATEGSIRLAIMISIQIIAIGLCAHFVLQNRMDIALAIFILTYLQRLSAQVFTLGDLLIGYDQAFLEASPMTEALERPTIVNDQPEAKELRVAQPDIRFDNVSYRYTDGAEEVVSGIDLVIPAGQKVGLVGHSGAGKTTISHLLLRFSDPTSGRILIDGNDISKVTQTSLREHIAYAPQEPILFHRSLGENIAYGRPGATSQEIWAAAQQAHAKEFIDKLPEGLNTVVGERGIKLSGGQRQRIAIARAILKDAPILVLDEATSALDSESELLIQDALSKLMKRRTSIVIAHRLSTIAKLDRIIVLKDGKVAEDGSHRQLLERGGVYASLWNHQSGGFIEE